MTEVEEKVSALIVQVCDTDEVLSDPDLDLFEAGLIDSMGFVELLFGLEQEFGLQVPPTEIERDDVSNFPSRHPRWTAFPVFPQVFRSLSPEHPQVLRLPNNSVPP